MADMTTQVAQGDGRGTAKIVQTAAELERLLDELGEIESFPPPPEFRARARIADPEVYAAAARDPEGYWAGRARELHWDTPFSTVLDESAAPFVTWFADVLLGEIDGCPFYIDLALDRAWHQDRFVLDVAAGPAEGFSLPAGDDLHFIVHSPAGDVPATRD